MPSPTSSTCPTSRDSTLRSKSVICLVRTLMISPALNLLEDIAGGLVEQESTDGFEPRADGGIDHAVADLDDHSAEQLRVHADVEDRLLLQHRREVARELTPLRVGKLGGSRH